MVRRGATGHRQAGRRRERGVQAPERCGLRAAYGARQWRGAGPKRRPDRLSAQQGNDVPKPRTAIGWFDGGHRLLLVAVDGSANFSAGLSFDDMAKLMVRLGATEAFMLDGGGSTELVARRPGDARADVVNTPSDGNERPVPNGVGLFSPRGSGTLRGLDVRLQADRVVPGLTMDVAAAGYDETWAPVDADKKPVKWPRSPARSAGRRTASSTPSGRGPGRCAPVRAPRTAGTSCGSSGTCTGWRSPSAPSRSTPAPRRASGSPGTTPTGSTHRSYRAT
ncbi:phosphodiester glycosidase family protein [Streptomyces sp. T1317-0309]|nr:phosphodiester glycosidase family protein [Streptomyces sp. T1317-0309]